MATLDETNIFGLPLKRQYGLEPEQKAPISEAEQASRQEYEQLIGSDNKFGLTFEGFLKAKERKKVSDQRKAVAQALTEGDTTKAYEGFTELPMVTDQLPAYMTPVLGNIIDEKERRYFGEKAGRQFKDPRDIELEMLMASDPRDVKQYTEKDPVAGAMSTLAGASSLIGIGEGPSLVKAGIMGMFPSLRKGMTAKTMDGQGGGSGGISEIPPEPKKDYAGFVSSVEKVALGPQKFGSGQDLINFIESPKRSGISKKELEYIDFDKIRNNPDLTKEDVIKYIQDNRPNIYRVERVEDNPTYKGGANENELNALPYNEVRSNEINAEEIRYWTDEHGNELLKQHDFLLNNPVLESNGFVINSDNIKNPTVLADFESFVNSSPEAYSYTDRPLIKINYPDNRTDIEVSASDIDSDDRYSFYQFRDVVEDGATLEFPTLKENPYDIAEEAATIRVSPDYGNQIDAYESFGDSGTNYQIIGNDETGYQVIIDGKRTDDYYNDLVDARGRIQSEAFDRGDILESADSFDNPYTDDQLIDIAPFEVIQGEATLPTKFDYAYGGDYQLPMGGANNYREFTLHIANPKTATRYYDQLGTKHFGGGDELLHYRTTDRIDEDGKKVLFVEEIQSDLHSTASSTRESANYELPKGTIEKTYADIEAIKPKDGKGLLAYNESVETEFEFTTSNGEVETLTPQEIVVIGKAMSKGEDSMVTPMGGLHSYYDISEDKINSFVDMYGKDNVFKIADMLEPIVMSGKLPDLPYKGNDYIELAVKDIMKLASEGDYDRVAFTNPATQLRRNRKDLAYIDSIEINQVPKLTEAEQQFNENWMRNRDRSMVSQMQPESVSGFDRIRLDGGLNNADFNSFVSTHTDFVVNDPQANKLWQDYHKNQNIEFNKNLEDYFDEYMVDNLNDLDDKILFDNDIKHTVQYVFAKADKPLTPTQVAEEVQKLLIKKAKFHHLRTLKNVLDNSASQDLNLLRQYKELKGADASSDAEVFDHLQKHALDEIEQQQGKPFGDINLENIVLPESITQKVNQNTRRAISSIMRSFYDHTLPNVEDAGRYIVKQKGTGFKVDKDKFMLEKGDMDDNLSTLKFESIEDILEGNIVEGDRRFFSLNKTLKEQIKKDAEKNNIPESSKDSQIYKIEGEMGEGKKPLDMYGKIIPQQLKKIAQKYDKNAKPQLKRVLYSERDDLNAEQIYGDFKKEAKGELGEAGKGNIYDQESDKPRTHESATIDITPEMRKAILTEGVNVMYKGGIVNKVKSMDKPIQGNTREM